MRLQSWDDWSLVHDAAWALWQDVGAMVFRRDLRRGFGKFLRLPFCNSSSFFHLVHSGSLLLDKVVSRSLSRSALLSLSWPTCWASFSAGSGSWPSVQRAQALAMRRITRGFRA